MAGIFGLIHTRDATAIPGFLSKAAACLTHKPWYVAESWAAPGQPVGIGRVGIGIFNRESQPVASPDGKTRLWLSGELIHSQALKKVLFPGRNAAEILDADLILAAYRTYGKGFAAYLNGAFFTVLYDSQAQTLLFANDRFGMYPHYIHRSPGQFVFAPEVKAILLAPGVDRKPDMTATAEYVRFQHLLGEKTFHEGVSLFPYGSVAEYEVATGRWFVERYWDWDQLDYNTKITFDEAVEEGGALLERAVVSRVDGVRVGLFLSGGLDSRSLLGFIPRDCKPHTVTYGQKNSRDVIYARQIAKVCGSQHHWFDMPNGNWIKDNVALHLDLTEGFHSWVHMHGITTLDSLRGFMDCNLSGWDGGTLMGDDVFTAPVFARPVDQTSVKLELYRQFLFEYTWPGLTDFEERLLFTPEMQSSMVGRAFESFQQEYSRYHAFPLESSAEYFYLANHCWRMTHNMITLSNAAVESRFPFWDLDLFEFIYSLPIHLRGDKVLFRAILTRKLPHLTRIPYEKNEYLPTSNKLIYNAQKLGMRVLKKLKIHPDRPRLYADYENYLRTDLRTWAEDILFDPRTTQRGIFDPKFVRSLMDRHLAGNEPWILGKIASLISYEMVLRAYFD